MTMTGTYSPDAILTPDISPGMPAVLPDVPLPDSERSRFSSPRLRYIGKTQTAVARRLRSHERRVAILGMEGVLVDTREATTLSWLVALYDCGHNVPLDLLRELSGMSGTELLRIASGVRADSPTGRQMLATQEKIFRTWYLPRLLPFIGARRLLQRMKADGLHLIVLSSGSSEMAPDLMRASGVAGLVDDVVAADGEPTESVLAGVIASALKTCGGQRDSIVMLGDCPYDVVAGRRNGVDVVALRCGGWSDSSLEGAVAVYQDHLHLLEQYVRSPFCARTESAPRLQLARVQ